MKEQKDKISREKIERYFRLTETALKEVKKHLIRGKEREAKQIIDMAENYISDAKHFFSKRDFVNCFAALNYAHGWIDTGARLGIFDVTDNQLFVIK